MTAAECVQIIAEVKTVFSKITEYSQKAQVDSFLSCYADSPDFLQISADGKVNNYEELKKACTEYYGSLKEQNSITLEEKFQVLDTNLVIMAWRGNIIAEFKNGDEMKMNNYSITSVFKKINGKWKVIHDHESALPPEIIKM